MSIASLFSNTKRTTAKGYVYCCVQYCKSCTKKNPELSFHNFPRAGKSMVEIKDFFGNVCVMDRREAWINQLKITKQTSPNLKVCSKHFTDDDFSTPNSLIYACRFLNKNAVPSKYLPLSEREQEKLENIKIIKDETASVSSPYDEEMPFEVAPEFALMDQDVYKQSSTVITEMDIKLEPLDAIKIKTEPIDDTVALNKTLEEDALIPTAEFNNFESFKLKTVKLEIKTEPFDEDTTVDVGELLTNEDIQNLVAENALSSNEVYVKQEFNHFETEQITVTKPEIANEVYVKQEFIDVKSEPIEINAIKPEIANKALPNRCNTCGAKFPSKELRDLHYIESTCKSRYVCEVCNMSCRSKWTLNNHQLKHTEERQFFCEKCESTFKYKAHWKLHMRKHTEEKNHVCTVCGAAFFQPSKLKYHMDVHTDSNPFSCETCGKKFKLRVSLYQHTLLHQGKKKKRDKSEYLKCEECGKMLSSTWTLSNHMLTHSGEKKFSCEQCGKNFTTVNALTLHSWIHKGKTFKCPHCPKKFAQKMNLTHHKKAHLGIKPHECDLCDKTFLASSQLKAHKLSHSGEKPHQCTICENKFVSAANLRIHLRIHTGEKPFSCDFCDKSFYDAGAKRKHVKKWHLKAFLESEKNKSNN